MFVLIILLRLLCFFLLSVMLKMLIVFLFLFFFILILFGLEIFLLIILLWRLLFLVLYLNMWIFLRFLGWGFIFWWEGIRCCCILSEFIILDGIRLRVLRGWLCICYWIICFFIERLWVVIFRRVSRVWWWSMDREWLGWCLVSMIWWSWRGLWGFWG